MIGIVSWCYTRHLKNLERKRKNRYVCRNNSNQTYDLYF